MTTVFGCLAAVCAGLFAYHWSQTAKFPPVYPMAYLSCPPNDVVQEMDKAEKINGYAAFFAMLAAAFQVVVIWLQTFG